MPKFSISVDEVMVTVNPGSIQCVTWASGYRYSKRYVGYSKKQAIREFRREFTSDYPNP